MWCLAVDISARAGGVGNPVLVRNPDRPLTRQVMQVFQGEQEYKKMGYCIPRIKKSSYMYV